MKNYSRLQLNQIVQCFCLIVLLTMFIHLTNVKAAPMDSSNSFEAQANPKAIRKGVMSIKGTPDKVHEYRRYIYYLNQQTAALTPGYTRPPVTHFETVDSTSEPYTIGTQYNPKTTGTDKDRGGTQLIERKFKWIAKYHVSAWSAISFDYRDILKNRPWGGAKVMWDSQNANRTSDEASTATRTSAVSISLGPFGSVSLPLTPSNEDEGVHVSREIFPSVQQQSSTYEPEPVEVRNFARIRVSAGVKGDAGWDGALEVLASVKVYASPDTNVDAWKQWTVKEAFVYPNAIR